MCTGEQIHKPPLPSSILVEQSVFPTKQVVLLNHPLVLDKNLTALLGYLPLQSLILSLELLASPLPKKNQGLQDPMELHHVEQQLKRKTKAKAS